MVRKAPNYSKLGEYIPHCNHHQNGGTVVRLVQSLSPSGHSMHSTERTYNGGTGWQQVHHMHSLSFLVSFQVALSATNHICQTPPSAPATGILYYGLNYVHWCCIHCRCLQYITGSVVPATSNDHNAFRISGTTNPIRKSHIPEEPNPLTHHSVHLKFTNTFFFTCMTESIIGQLCGYIDTHHLTTGIHTEHTLLGDFTTARMLWSVLTQT
jgi:hypothetical protein